MDVDADVPHRITIKREKERGGKLAAKCIWGGEECNNTTWVMEKTDRFRFVLVVVGSTPDDMEGNCRCTSAGEMVDDSKMPWIHVIVLDVPTTSSAMLVAFASEKESQKSSDDASSPDSTGKKIILMWKELSVQCMSNWVSWGKIWGTLIRHEENPIMWGPNKGN